jgi:hypothetical protein
LILEVRKEGHGTFIALCTWGWDGGLSLDLFAWMADIDTSGRESNLEFVTRVFIFEKSHAALCGTASIEIGFYEYGCINLSMNLL